MRISKITNLAHQAAVKQQGTVAGRPSMPGTSGGIIRPQPKIVPHPIGRNGRG